MRQRRMKENPLSTFAFSLPSRAVCRSETLRASAAAGLMAVALAVSTAGQCSYTVTSIPRPPNWGPIGGPVGDEINNLGHVGGTLVSAADTTRAFFWSPETGTVVLPLPPGYVSMEGRGINDLDQVVGSMWGTDWRGFIWDANTQDYTFIDVPSWANQIDVNGINNQGQVVGTFLHTGGNGIRAFVWQDGMAQELDTIIGLPKTYGKTINELGDIGGEALVSQAYHAFIVRDGAIVDWLPEGGLATSQVNAISNNGAAVGQGSPVVLGTPGFRNFGLIWASGEVEVVQPASDRHTEIRGINDAGRAVGAHGSSPNIAILWQNGVFYDVNQYLPPGTPIVGVLRDINDAGQLFTGNRVLTPIWLPGDVTGDCHVSLADLLLVLSNFGSPLGTYPQGDVDGDGEVDLADLAILLAHWGE